MQNIAHKSSKSWTSGFSLIELMIVVAIISILASLAIPEYSQYKVKAHRAAGEQFLLDVAQRQEQYFLDARSYAANLGASGAGGYLGMTAPSEVTNYYTVDAFVISTSPPGYQISLTPVTGGVMDGKGVLVITNKTASVSTS